MEERLAGLQIEEVALKLRYRPQSPKLLDVQSQIKVLREIPEIQNARYYDYLSTLLPGLEEAREALARKQRPGNPALAEADARLAFVKKTLEERPVSPPETAGPPGSLGTP